MNNFLSAVLIAQSEGAPGPNVGTWLILIIFAALVAYFMMVRPFMRGMRGQDYVCIRCHTIGEPKLQTKGSFLIEVILWLLFIIPGLIYSIWRHTSRERVCRSCHGPVIDTTSPEGQRLTQPRNVSPPVIGNRV